MGQAAFKGTPAKWAAISSYIAFALLYSLAIVASNIRVETAQSNGLAQVQYPYSTASFFATLAALGVLFFGITLSIAILRKTTAKPRRLFLGSGLLSAGVLAILFALFWSFANWLDEGPRCLGGCPLSTIQYYQTVDVASTIITISGLAALGYGARLLMRRATVDQRSFAKS